jgi:hypothetical protein
MLAPANTQDVQFGEAKREEAAMRADEMGAFGLWCDSGAGGSSGVVGQGESGVQRGQGSFVRSIGLRLGGEGTFGGVKMKATLYARGGDAFSLMAIWAVFAAVLIADRYIWPDLGPRLARWEHTIIGVVTRAATMLWNCYRVGSDAVHRFFQSVKERFWPSAEPLIRFEEP